MIDGVGSARRRMAIGLAVVALHGVLVVLLVIARPSTHRAAEVSAMIVEAVPAATAPPTVVADFPFDVGLAAPAVEVAVPPPTSPRSCDIIGTLGSVLRADPAAAGSLKPIATGPAQAIMAWNGQWSAQPETVPFRRAVTAALVTARADCLDEKLTGPRILFLTTDGMTISVALGSGNWRWRDLLSSDQYLSG